MKSIIANQNITASTVRVVSEGTSTVMAIKDALVLASNAGLDLVQVSEADVPVVKVLDLNKFNYEQKQAEKMAQKKQRQNTVQTKEIQFTYGTQQNDLQVKAKSAGKFLDEGKQVRVVMKIAGRNTENKDIMNQNMKTFNSFISLLGNVDFVQKIDVQGKNLTCTLKASTNKIKK